jgi:hypothetical protein
MKTDCEGLLMAHQKPWALLYTKLRSYWKMMKEAWFLAPKELKFSGLRKTVSIILKSESAMSLKRVLWGLRERLGTFHRGNLASLWLWRLGVC